MYQTQLGSLVNINIDRRSYTNFYGLFLKQKQGVYF